MREFLKLSPWDRLPKILKFIFVCIFAIISFFVILYLGNKWGTNLIKINNDALDAKDEIEAWLYFLSGAGTISLAWVAWLKIGHIDKQNEGNFLLNIDERWDSPQSIRARTIIHALYLQTEDDNKKLLEKLSPNCRESSIQHSVGKEIIKMGEKEEKVEEFLYLLNFLDFMETIGYMEDNGHVSSEALDALCGEALLFNYYIFQPYIMQKRVKHHNPEFYENFEKLFKKLKKKSESHS